MSRFLFAPVDPIVAGWFVGDRAVVDGFACDGRAWSVASEVRRGSVANGGDLAAAIEAAMRGADLLLAVADHLREPFVDLADRIDLHPWRPNTSEWSGLLDALAAGANIAEAARGCNMSLRSAYRWLTVARDQLGVHTNTAAAAAWAALRTTLEP